MKEIATYLAQVSLLTASSYIIYKTVFARNTLQHAKRFVLLLLIVSSFALPVCRITIEKTVNVDALPVVAEVTGVIPAPEAIATGGEVVQTAAPATAPVLWTAVGIIYLAGVVWLLAYRLAGVVRVRRIMRRAVGRAEHDGIDVLLVEGDMPAFGFGGKIVMPRSDYETDAGMIIRHEAVHIRQRHGADLALVNIAMAFQWFNPFVWLLRRELVLVHELAADRGVIQSGIDAKKYQYLLISKSVCAGGLLPVASHLRTSDLHKRIMTMKRKTSRASALKLLFIPPLAAVALAAFANTRYIVQEPGTPSADGTTTGRGQFHMPFELDKKDGIVVSAPFGKRVHPVTGKEAVHNGIDIRPANDTIRAPYSGIVKSAVLVDGMGNRLVITHADGLETLYGHLEKFLVPEGATVKGGQPVAIVGNTGHSSGKHLHFETRVDGKPVDPTKTLPLSF